MRRSELGSSYRNDNHP